MAATDLLNIFQWWLVWLGLGLAFLPLSTSFFSSFFDRGYIFSKILGVLLLSYLAWLLASLKLLTFTQSLLPAWGILLACNLFLAFRIKIPRLLRPIWRIILSEEILFLAGLLFWAYIKSFEPSIHGLEKYMDFGFINSLLRADYFPPQDLWLTPFSINYYYFGHLTTAVLTKISNLTPAVTYNLMLASLFSLTLTASFSIGANLYRFFLSHPSISQLNAFRPTFFAGAISAFLVTLGGNLHPIYAFFQNYSADNPVPFWQLPVVFNFSGYWYPNATRFIPFTIHEFPSYSFVVSDLHGHVLNIPFVLLLIALLITVFVSSKLPTTHYLLLALLTATNLMTNVLDGPIYLLVIFFVLATRFSLSFAFQNLVLISGGAVLFSLPYWLSFKPFTSGIGLLCAPQFLINLGKIGPLLFEANHCARSPVWMLAILWGFFYFVIFGFIIFVIRSKESFRLPFSTLKKPFSILHFPSSTDLLVAVFILASTILILIPEFFYAKDIYPAHYRANTVFKFGYQAFIIFSLTSGYIIMRILTQTKSFLVYRFVLGVLFFLVAIYPYFTINSYYNGLKNYQGLDGLSYLNGLYPADYRAILWAQDNIQGQPVILEAQGDSYTDFARVSVNTGLPTVIGWPVHEWLWRGSYDEAGKRSTEVTQLYESSDINLTKQLIDKFKIKYVFIGSLEREKYKNLDENKFYNLGTIIYQNGETKIYQLN